MLFGIDDSLAAALEAWQRWRVEQPENPVLDRRLSRRPWSKVSFCYRGGGFRVQFEFQFSSSSVRTPKIACCGEGEGSS